MNSFLYILLFCMFVISVSAGGVIFGLTSSIVCMGEHYAVEQINDSQDLTKFIESNSIEKPQKIIILDINGLDQTILHNKESFKSLIQSSSSSFIIPHNSFQLQEYTSSIPILHESITNIEEIQLMMNNYQNQTQGHYIILFQLPTTTNTIIQSPFVLKTSNSGKYLTPDLFLGLCILFIFIMGLWGAYQLINAIQTPTEWAEKPLNVGKLY